MSAIRWEDPPPRSHGTRYRPARNHDWPAVGKALACRPNRWAVIAICDNVLLAGAMAHHIRTGKYRALAEFGAFEAVSRSVDGERRVYARWVGEPS